MERIYKINKGTNLLDWKDAPGKDIFSRMETDIDWFVVYSDMKFLPSREIVAVYKYNSEHIFENWLFTCSTSDIKDK